MEKIVENKEVEIIIDQDRVRDEFWVHNLITLESFEKINNWFYVLKIKSDIHKYLDIRRSTLFTNGESLTCIEFSWTRDENQDSEEWKDARDHQCFEIRFKNFPLEYFNMNEIALKWEYELHFYNIDSLKGEELDVMVTEIVEDKYLK